MEKCKEFLKDKKNLLIVILGLCISILLTLRIPNDRVSLGDLKTFNIWLFFLISLGVTFVFSHFLWNIKKVYQFIYQKRFFLAFIIFILLVLGKFNGSSIGLWDQYVEPSESFEQDIIIGEARPIRSDEWLVNTPYAFSQQYNHYKYYNELARGTKTDMYSSIFAPVADILILARPFNIGYMLFGEEYGLSIYWYGRLIALFLVTFEFCMLITREKKLPSLVGAILIAGSPVVQWFYSNYIVDLLISGQLCLLMFHHFLANKESRKKILYSVLIAFAFNWFALTLYPAWQIPLGYMYLVFAIWIFIKHLPENRAIKDYKYLGITVILIGIMIGRYIYLGHNTINIIMSTVYPGSRNELGGESGILNFVYPISIFFPISNYRNPCEAAAVYSLFPVPIILSIIYLIKNRKQKDKTKEKLLIILLTVLTSFYAIFTMVELPQFITKITLLKMSPSKRIVPIIGILCTYLLILLIGKIKLEGKLKKGILLIGTIIAGYGIVRIGNLNQMEYGTLKKIIGATLVLAITIYLLITSSNKKNGIVFSILMIALGLSNIALVNPVNTGTKVVHDKSVAKEIQKIVKKDKSSWIAVNSITLGNYVLMNGGKTINSTNIYPNLELWKKLDPEEKYADIYNRYAHIDIILTEEETSFEIVQSDYFNLYLNYEDVEKLDAKYIITPGSIPIPEAYQESIQEIYQNDNIWIYQYNS